MVGWRKIITVLIILIILLLLGTSGYMYFEQMNVVEALYMTVITLSTVGFREVRELSPRGQIFTIIIIFTGLGTAFYSLSTITSFIIEGEFHYLIRRHLMEKKITLLKEHYIICGSGETGSHVINQFRHRQVPFVVIERNESRAQHLLESNTMVLIDDATSEKVLKKAGIHRAKGLISCLSTDADNIFTVLTARELVPDLHIIAQAINEKTDAKLRKAGADNTVSPNEIGGTRMAALALRPAIVSFLDVVTHAKEITLDLEEIQICTSSSLEGKKLSEVRIPEESGGLIIMALATAEEEKLQLNPCPEQILEKGTRLIVLGQQDQVNRLRKLACDVDR